MIITNPKDALHKAVLYRVLSEILDDSALSHHVYFKGGSAAASLGWLDRFSLDLDFDLKRRSNKSLMRKHLKNAFMQAGVSIKQEDAKELFFILKYDAPEGSRNTLKVGIIDKQLTSNTYGIFLLPELNRLARCQTRETMMANKLVALTERFEKYHAIAGRDVYDTWYFFSQGYTYRKEVIRQRRKKSALLYLVELANFVESHVDETLLREDLSYLLPKERFAKARKFLKQELLLYLRNEVARLGQN